LDGAEFAQQATAGAAAIVPAGGRRPHRRALITVADARLAPHLRRVQLYQAADAWSIMAPTGTTTGYLVSAILKRRGEVRIDGDGSLSPWRSRLSDADDTGSADVWVRRDAASDAAP
jgi:hypothetical protein